MKQPELIDNQLYLLKILLPLFAALIFIVNGLFFHFPGNDYLPAEAYFCLLSLLLMSWGCRLLFDAGHRLVWIVDAVLQTLFMMFLIGLAANAIQLTPFQPIDLQILKIEQGLSIKLQALLEFTKAHPGMKYWLILVYSSLTVQLILLPLLLIVLNQKTLLKEYWFLMFATTLIGFGFYYFFPTLAPASVLEPSLFDEEQLATGLKFRQIHQGIWPSSLSGGLIALPSFHVIWAWIIVYALRPWPWLALIVALINTLLTLSCVLLGWHYPLDILGSLIVLALGYFWLKTASQVRLC